MSPNYFISGASASQEWRVGEDGGFDKGWVNMDWGVRAVINLKSDVEIISGIGTSNDPFLVKEV